MITLDDALQTGRGVERTFSCPNGEAHAHGDANASASVNVVKGYWTCYACGAKGTVEGWLPDPKESLRALEEIDKPIRTFTESWLDLFDADHTSSYWTQRFGTDVTHRYRCGTHPMTNNPTYPLRASDGTVLGVVQRTDGTPKYLYPAGPRVSQTLFWSPPSQRTDVLILVEGAADVMALDQAGLPEGWRAAGCFGAGLHMAQLDLINCFGPKVIIAAYDSDPAGEAAIARAITICSPTAETLSHPWSNFGGKDAGDTPVNQRIPALNSTLESNGYGRFTD